MYMYIYIYMCRYGQCLLALNWRSICYTLIM